MILVKCAKCGKEKQHYAFGLCLKCYQQRPEVKAHQKAYKQRPEVKAHQKAYKQRPEVRAYQKAYKQRPEIKERQRLRYYTPRYQKQCLERVEKKALKMGFSVETAKAFAFDGLALAKREKQLEEEKVTKWTVL